jgi:hypothetical protein
MARNRTYLLPQVLVQQDFASLPASATQELIAVIVGPQKLIRDINDPSDLELVSYGTFDTLMDKTYTLKGVDDLDVIEKDSVNLQLKDVFARYATLSGTTQIKLGSAQNLLTLDTTQAGFVEHLNNDGTTAFARNAFFKNRDVKVGDGVIVTEGGAIKSQSRIIELIRDVVAPTAGSITADASNVAVATGTSVFSSTVVDDKDTDRTVSASTVLGAANSFTGDLALGYLEDTYTIEVVTAGNATNARFRVTSVKGDNVDNVAITGTSPNQLLVVGTKGSRVVFSSFSTAFILGEKYTVTAKKVFPNTTPTAVDANLYAGLFNTVYEVQVVKGGVWADLPQVAVTTTNGIDYSSPQTVASDTNFFLGSLGVKAKFATGDGLRLGDKFYVVINAASAGATKTVKIADPLPSSVTSSTVISVDFCYRAESVEIPRVGYPTAGSTAWSLNSDGTEITVSNDIYVLNSEFTEVGGLPLQMIVKSANVFVGYRALQLAKTNQINTISDAGLIESQIGKVVPENPVAYAVLKALQNSAGTKVYYVPVDEDSVDGYNRAFDATTYDGSAYYIVPTSGDQQVLQAAKSHVLAASADDRARERIAIVSESFSSVVDLYSKKVDGQAWVGYVSAAPGSSPAVYNRVTVPGAHFLTDGIRPGDIFRSDFTVNALGQEVYQSFRVVSVSDEENIVLESPAFATAVGSSINPRRVQVVRALSKNEQALLIAGNSEAYGSRRVVNVWPDFLQDGDKYVDGYFGAAAIAGLKSGVAPHQPLTNVILNGFTKADRSTPYFTLSQLNTVANGGTWIIDQDRFEGAIYNRHQLTTDYTDDNMAEISITTNLDSIAKILREDLKAFIGQYNNHPFFQELMRTRLVDRLTFLQSNAVTLKAGAQLIDYEVVQLETDPLIRTRVLATVNLTLPYPVNVIQLKLNVI